MIVQFAKYHGTGNDFVMIDGRNQDTSFLDQKLIHSLCDRRFGIGGDGLIILQDSQALDLAVARHRFVKASFINRAAGLPTYYAAQMLLALTVGST